jgi:hypothetical protein
MIALVKKKMLDRKKLPISIPRIRNVFDDLCRQQPIDSYRFDRLKDVSPESSAAKSWSLKILFLSYSVGVNHSDHPTENEDQRGETENELIGLGGCPFGNL